MSKEYKVIRQFFMDFRRGKGRSEDRSDTITLKEGQILELVDEIDGLFKIQGTKIGIRPAPWTIDACLEEIRS